MKIGKGFWHRLIPQNVKKPHFLKLDFDRWQSESDAEEEKLRVSLACFCIGLCRQYPTFLKVPQRILFSIRSIKDVAGCFIVFHNHIIFH